jgi:NAD(P)-dependent dehydrogenase (short-subunit alcohol dehydrogenase family)
MKILVLGGYGEFGGRLCRLLLRDGHEVVVAGRSLETAQHFCQQHGGIPFCIDIHSDLHLIESQSPDAVVDAVGPYQSYGNDPYRVARAVLTAGAHYMDLSDSGAFTAGITELDSVAKDAGLFALSGVSSTPAFLQFLGELRRLRWIPGLKTFLKPLRFLARLLTHLCRDHGAMVVEVTGPNLSDGEHEVHRWTLLADPGQGPFVPTIAVRAILRDSAQIKPGARPCLAELPLQTFTDAMADIGVVTSVLSHRCCHIGFL